MQTKEELNVTKIERDIISIERVELDNNYNNYDLLIVKVKTRVGFFWEYYVGVPKEDYFYLDVAYLPERSQLYKFITSEAFTKFNCKKYISTKEAKSPLDGAWLSFARPGTEYDYLKDEYFYYSGGFLIYDYIPYLNNEQCYISSQTQIKRLFDFLNNNQNINIKKPYLPSLLKIIQDIKTDSLYKQDLFIYNRETINKVNLLNFIKNDKDIYELKKIFLLEEFDENNQSNIYNVLNSSNFFVKNINNRFILELEYSKYENRCYIMHEDYISQFVILLMKTHPISIELSNQVRSFIYEYLTPDHYNYLYWQKLMSNSSIKKLNKHDSNNLKQLFIYLIKEKNRKWVFSELKI